MFKDYTELVVTATGMSGDVDAANYSRTLVGVLEAKLSRKLKVRQSVETRRVKTSDIGQASLPGDFIQMIHVMQADEFIDAVPYQTVINDNYSGYSILGTKIHCTHKSADLDLTYYAKLPSLEETGCNWLLEEAPDIYLHGLVMEIAAKNLEIEKVASIKPYLDGLIQEFLASSRVAETTKVVSAGVRP